MINFYEFEQILEQQYKKATWNLHPKGSEEYKRAANLGDRMRVMIKSRRTGKSVEEIRKEEEKEKEKEKAQKAKLAAKRRDIK